MATFSMLCPHCGKDNTSFTVDANFLHPQTESESVRTFTVYAHCNACYRGVCAVARQNRLRGQGDNVVGLHGDLASAAKAEVISIDTRWMPLPSSPDIPGHLPGEVERVFQNAEKLKVMDGQKEAAGMLYRKALEVALKVVAPEINGMLASRIQKLADAHRLTPEMYDYAKTIKNLGNDAAHEIPEIDPGEVNDMANFVRLFLLYQFTLPGMLKARTPPAKPAVSLSTGAP